MEHTDPARYAYGSKYLADGINVQVQALRRRKHIGYDVMPQNPKLFLSRRIPKRTTLTHQQAQNVSVFLRFGNCREKSGAHPWLSATGKIGGGKMNALLRACVRDKRTAEQVVQTSLAAPANESR